MNNREIHCKAGLLKGLACSSLLLAVLLGLLGGGGDHSLTRILGDFGSTGFFR